MTTGGGNKPIEILLVEDNPADARLTVEIISQSDHQTNIAIAEDGELAVARLRREGDLEDAPPPDLILLDLRLPKKDGYEVLEEINADSDLVQIPVVILTGTEAEQSLVDAYNIPPNRYWRKPIDLLRFHIAIGQLGLFSRQPIRMSSPEAKVGSEAAKPVGASARKWWWPFGSG